MDIASFGEKRSYNDFKKHIALPILPLFDSIRGFCLTLGKDVVEDVRMHRVVFGKSLTFRWFADLEPTADDIIIKIQKNRKEQPQIIHVKSEQKISELEKILREAYQTIH